MELILYSVPLSRSHKLLSSVDDVMEVVNK